MPWGMNKKTKVRELDGGDGCPRMWMDLMPLSCILSNGEDGKLKKSPYSKLSQVVNTGLL